MVAAVGYALFGTAAGISAFGVTLTTVAGTLTLAGQVVNLVALTALSKLTAKGGPVAPSPDDLQVNSKVSTGDRFIHVGTVKVGGNHVFHRAYYGSSYRLIVLGESVTSIERVDLDREIVTLDGSGLVTDSFLLNEDSRVRVLTRLGAIPETHYSEITALWPEWTVNHRMDGLCTGLVISDSVAAQDQQSTFPNGEPELQMVLKGQAFVDPRTDSTAWTDNAALVINGFAGHPAGLNDAAFFDPADIMAEADASAVLVDVVGGGAENRWRLNGSFSRSQRPQDVLKEMMVSCGARMRLKGNGYMGLRLPRDVVPTVTLTDAHIIRVVDHEPGPDLLDRYNEATATFTDPDLNYTSTTSNPLVNDDLVERYGGAVRADTANLPYAPSNRQAMDALSAAMARDNPVHEPTILFRLDAFEASNKFEITMDAPLFGYQGKYEPVASEYVIEGGFLIAVQMRLRKISETAYAPTPVARQGEKQEFPTNSQSDSGVPLPTGFAASGSGIETASGSFVAGIAAAWDASPSDSLTPVLLYKGVSVAPDLFTGQSLASDATTSQFIGLVDGSLYDLELYYVSADGTKGSSVTISNVTAVASITPPNPPTSLSVSDLGGGSASVQVVASDSSSNRETILYRDAVEVYRVVTSPSAAITFVDVSGAGTFDWTARASNVSGVASATDAGPITQTITA
tara:strand:- start:1249 stop:3303 length:2055 start_codon:yes stop_codon:yes gene_type:complete